MSYEGYVQALCEHGHLRSWDCYDESESRRCSCGGRFVFTHQVDETNGEGMRMEFEVASNAVTTTCSLGFTHVVQETKFKIPVRATERQETP